MAFFTRYTNNKILDDILIDASQYDSDFDDKIAGIDIDSYLRIYKDPNILGKMIIDINREGIDLYSTLEQFNDIYMQVVESDSLSEKRSFELLYRFCLKYLFKEGEIHFELIDPLIKAFDKKNVAIDALDSVVNILDLDTLMVTNLDNLKKLLDYPIKAREYYVDDRAILSSFINLLRTNGLRDYMFSETNIDRLISKKLKEDKKQNGIYDIDRGTLAEISHKCDSLENASLSIRILIDTATNVIAELRSETEKGKEEINNLKIKELDELQNKANEILRTFNQKYLELLQTEKGSLSKELVRLLDELEREFTSKKIELVQEVSELGGKVDIQLSRVSRATSQSLKQIDEYVKNNDEVKRILSEAKENSTLIDGLKIVTDRIQEGTDILSEPNRIVVPQITLPKEERVVDNTINYYLNDKISFNERFESILREKEKLESQGIIFHEKFDDILKLIMKGKVPYMYGPSGCGKTYMIESQLANLLGMNVITNGYVLYEQDIIGYTNSATGAYVPNNFYRAFKYGDMIFLDELDNGIANATVVLNRFLGSNNKNYTFPDGIPLDRHPNFRIVSAGNTNGSGRTLAHNTRQKMDESVMQRLTPVEVKYDNRVEKRILKDHQDWYQFAVLFRKAIESIPGRDGETNTVGTFTTRDAESVKEYLDDSVFNDEQIMDYEIIQTKDIDTLTKLSKEMNKNKNELDGDSIKLLKLFDKKVSQRRGN